MKLEIAYKDGIAEVTLDGVVLNGLVSFDLSVTGSGMAIEFAPVFQVIQSDTQLFVNCGADDSGCDVNKRLD